MIFDIIHIIQYDTHMTNETPIWAQNYTPRQNAPKPQLPAEQELTTELALLAVDDLQSSVNAMATLATKSLEYILRNPGKYPAHAVAAAKEVLARTLGAIPDTVIQNNTQFIVKWQDEA